MLLETVEDNGLCAIEKPADSGEKTIGEQQGQAKPCSAAIQMAWCCKTPSHQLITKKMDGFKTQFKMHGF